MHVISKVQGSGDYSLLYILSGNMRSNCWLTEKNIVPLIPLQEDL